MKKLSTTSQEFKNLNKDKNELFDLSLDWVENIFTDIQFAIE